MLGNVGNLIKKGNSIKKIVYLEKNELFKNISTNHDLLLFLSMKDKVALVLLICNITLF